MQLKLSLSIGDTFHGPEYLNYGTLKILIYPENRGNWFLRNVGTYLPNYTASHPTTCQFSQKGSYKELTLDLERRCKSDSYVHL
jgi:hypothetical protein